jgi:aryl carrier-like protein
LRGDHPMLDAGTWTAALRDAGFEASESFPAAGSPAGVLAQHVVVGRNPGASPGAAIGNGGGRFEAVGPANGRQDARAAATELAAAVAAAAPHERDEILAAFVRGQIAALLRLDATVPIDRHRRLMELGLDSLMAVELRARLGRGLALEEPLPATLVFDHPSIDAIVALLGRRFEAAGGGDEDVTRTKAPAAMPTIGSEALDELSDDEVESRLMERLRELEERTS